MDWQVAAIIVIVAITVTGFVRDEISQRRLVGRPLRRVRGHELHRRAERQVTAGLPLSAEEQRRRRLRAVGF